MLPLVPRRLGSIGRAGFKGRRPTADARRRWRSIAETKGRWEGRLGDSSGPGDVPELQRQGSGGVFPVFGLHPCRVVGEPKPVVVLGNRLNGGIRAQALAIPRGPRTV